MFSQILAKFIEKFIYGLPAKQQAPLFIAEYSFSDTKRMLSMLLSLFDKQHLNCDSAEVNLLKSACSILFKQDISLEELKPVAIDEGIKKFNPQQRQEFLVLSIIIALSNKDEFKSRLKLLLENKSYFNCDTNIWTILTALKNDDLATLRKPNILGEAYHNKKSRINGIKEKGWFEYKRQMKMMRNGVDYLKMKQKYGFLNTISSNTLGGQFRDLLRKQNLSLPGEANGFAEFFIWHDLSHSLSGNGTDYQGEMGANAFTVGYSRKAKIRILLFGLIQWNLGINLAVVAKPHTNVFKDRTTTDIYFKSLLAGSHANYDFLEWPIDDMFADLHDDIDEVRAKYHIVPIHE